MPEISDLLVKAAEWAARAEAAATEADRALCVEVEESYRRLAASVRRLKDNSPTPTNDPSKA